MRRIVSHSAAMAGLHGSWRRQKPKNPPGRVVGLGRTANFVALDLDGLLLPFIDVQMGRLLAS